MSKDSVLPISVLYLSQLLKHSKTFPPFCILYYINISSLLYVLYFRFTALVEGHLTDMCICLKDDNVVVREKTLTLLLQLLQEDYLKLRCPLLFHLFSMINDESQKICDKMKSFIISSEVKQKNILLQHFIECIFHYNGYNVSNLYQQYMSIMFE